MASSVRTARTGGGPSRRTADAAVASPVRAAPGATRAAVLAALASGEPMTAGELAEKSGLARPTVSTTLSRLARSGEVQKAERGYRLAPTSAPTEPATEAVTGAIAGAPTEPTTSTVADTPPGESGNTAAGETTEAASAEAGETAHVVAGAAGQATLDGA